MFTRTPLLAAAVLALSTAAAYVDLGDQLAKLLADDGAVDDWFGRSVAIGGGTAIVGASLNDDNGENSGSAYLFDITDPAKPVQLFKLLADDGAAGDAFGHSVAIGGPAGNEIAIVGARNNDDNGSAYLFVAGDTPACPWDCGGENDGNVGIVDFLALLAQWGMVDATCDFGLGAPGVGIEEFLKLLGNWGPCPN